MPMRKFVLIAAGLLAAAALYAQAPAWPKTLDSGPWETGHVQGIALDKDGYMYLSFTDVLVKMDLSGRVVGTVTGLLGHLGCLDYNAEDGLIYGSLEYKDDVIGQGILKRNQSDLSYQNTFYIAMIDGSKIVREGMDALRDGVVRCVNLPMVVSDYETSVLLDGREVPHRLGCSGIDGVSFGPDFGRKGGRQYLTVAYGIYGDAERSDNDYQVLLQFDTRDWARRYAKPLEVGNMHRDGPAKPRRTYYAYTGNTSWGVQNLEYDPFTGYWLMAVYKGKKPQFPNYTLFAADGAVRARKQPLAGVPYVRKGRVVSLAPAGRIDAATGIRGWKFKYGSTGLLSLGDGLWYISENGKTPDKKQYTTLRLYRWTGAEDGPFEPVD